MKTLNLSNLLTKHFLSVLLTGLIVVAATASAQTGQAKPVETSKKFGDYTVHFSVFNSTFIPADIAKTYQLIRGENRALINISVTRTADGKTSLGLPGRISGLATNLIQQQKSLEFKTINEGDATYYLASLRHTNEEVINFDITITPEGETKAFNVKFTRTLHIQ